ncbi:MAG: phosphoribosylanthranilate isomerase [Candidatus Obscuribacterales bacterium]|nr:phosphoribosylanthranilate isomerase [Candidatus Obscuribacterales bacterium]
MTCLVKICGITNLADAQAAIHAGADLLGFIFVETSPRHISPRAANQIIETLPQSTKTVGVFQNEVLGVVNDVAMQLRLDYVQLHGHEQLDYCDQVSAPIVKVLSLDCDDSSFEQFKINCDIYSEDVEFILVDRPKSALEPAEQWLQSAVKFLKTQNMHRPPLMFAGGLNCDNIRYVMDELSPFGIDCASGIESSPGVKDHDKLKRFVEAIKGERVT